MAQRRVLVRCTLLCMVRRLRLTAVVGSRTKKKKCQVRVQSTVCVFFCLKNARTSTYYIPLWNMLQVHYVLLYSSNRRGQGKLFPVKN